MAKKEARLRFFHAEGILAYVTMPEIVAAWETSFSH
jgi:hypothetical protein